MSRLAPLWQQNSTYPAATDRALLAALWPASASAGGAPSLVAGTMQVSVAAGWAAVALTGGNYTQLCRWDAAELVTLAAAPPSGQSRIDLVVVQVRDTAVDAGANNDFLVTNVTGTPAPSNPVAPVVPNNAYAICQVLVPGAAANLNGATLTDRRVGFGPLGTAAAGILPGGYAQITAQSGTVGSSAAPVPGVTLTLTTLPGRRYRIRVVGAMVMVSGGPSNTRPAIWQDGAPIAGTFVAVGASPTNFQNFTVEAIVQPTPGSHTWTLYISTDTGSASVYATAQAPIFMTAEDIGGN